MLALHKRSAHDMFTKTWMSKLKSDHDFVTSVIFFNKYLYGKVMTSVFHVKFLKVLITLLLAFNNDVLTTEETIYKAIQTK